MDENLSHALYMAFAVAIFIIACSYSLYMVHILNTTAKTLVYRLDETNYYDSLTLTDLIDSEDSKAYRKVGVETIISTLYRYYKESFCVKIVDTDGTLLQMFDTTVEGDIMTALTTTRKNDYQNAILKLYGTSDKACYMFGAPWIGSTENTKERIDLYVNGGAGYINNVYVDYTTNNLRSAGTTFKEIFTQYAYSGDTITSDDGEETLTGTAETETKIVITYQKID